MTSIYDPWSDLGRRFPGVHLEMNDMWPARAAWIPGTRVMFIERSLSRAQARSALAHEIAHMDLGHAHHDPCHDHRREREADRLAARRLIHVGDLAEAYAWTHDDEQLADLLNVDVSTVHARLGTLHPAERHYIEARIALIEIAA